MITFAPGSAASHIRATSASEAPVTICTASTGTLHFSDRLTQTVSAGGATVNQLVIQEAVARFVIGEREDLVYGPGGPVLAARLNSMSCSYWSSQASSRRA
jgi:hypothetical protein